MINLSKLCALTLSVGFAFALAMHSLPASAAVIAIADSGTDTTHPELSKKLWSNPGELDNAVDNDDDGKIGDVHGWNFIDNNNHYYNYKLLGTFPKDVYTFFEVQTRAILGIATQADKDWYNAHIKDRTFIAKLEEFGGFVHGTHVAGIASKGVDGAQIMALKTIGAKSASLLELAANSKLPGKGKNKTGIPSATMDKAVRFGLDYLAKAQGQLLGPVGQYIGEKHAQVVNCSFGSSTAALAPVLKPLLQKLIPNISDAQVKVYVNYLIDQMVVVMEQSFILASPHSLFVIAAGNDGTNNDESPASPANVRTDNSITVAATLQNTKLAFFSNYGNVHVDIAAPGVGILSTVPGGEHLLLSGTSQATPAVTRIAGEILDANPKLSPGEVKMILMETVDHQKWLEGKVKSEGTANEARAIYAAKASTTMSVGTAVAQAKINVGASINSGAQGGSNFASSIDESSIYVAPIPQLIQ
jgi:hypothetical protein